MNVLRESGIGESSRALTPRAELRASFQMFHELVVLQKLVEEAKSVWGPPRDWTAEQYHELVRSINLAQENMGSSEIGSSAILTDAFSLRYQFEEIAENQRKLSQENAAAERFQSVKPLPSLLSPTKNLSSTSTPVASDSVHSPTRSYFSTFEKLLPSTKTNSIKNVIEKPLTPRHATMAKYARLYLESDERAKQPWAIERINEDDVRDKLLASPWSDEDVAALISNRFESDRIYTWLSNHSMLTVNPFRMLQTAKFTSIYAEDVVLAYATTANATRELAPHPFAVAKTVVTRAFVDTVIRNNSVGVPASPAEKSQKIWLCGESGSGKTELAKELLKYFVLVAEPVLSTLSEDGSRNKGSKTKTQFASQPRVQLFTSSTKSTVQMRTEEARTIAMLEAKGIEEFEIVLLDLNPERWGDMEAVSHSRRLPQLHVDGLFFGFYDTLEHLDDIEQLRLYLKNPRAAKKLSMVLDSNVVLEAFGHAVTEMNTNSSRFGKTIDIDMVVGRHPAQFQIRGCRLAPFLLEKSRVTSTRIRNGALERNFHIFYAMVGGVNAVTHHKTSLATELRLVGASCDEFTYLGKRGATKSGVTSARDAQATLKRDAEKWLRILDSLAAMDITNEEQRAIFKILSAILWLGNIEFEAEATADGGCVKMASISQADEPSDPSTHVVSLLGLQSIAELSRMLTTKRVSMATTGENFELKLEKRQVCHVRDALARLLYQSVFLFIVDRMNAITESDRGSKHEQTSRLELVDVFGFEALQHNSLDQLCINYLSEKLFCLQDKVLTLTCQRGAATESGSNFISTDSDNNVLSLFEHPSSGIFACLEEMTVLHQGENESTDQERKKNILFVRNLLERSPVLAAESSSINGKKSVLSTDAPLLFTVPHTRVPVLYDADEFVKKNSDFVYLSLLEDLAASCSKELGFVLSNTRQRSADNDSKMVPATLVRQFRSQVNSLTRKISHDNSTGIDDQLNRSFYFHCVRPNANARPSGTDASLILQQVRAQRLTHQINLSEALTKVCYPVAIPIESLLKRYGCLVDYTASKRSEAIHQIGSSANTHELISWCHTLVHPDCSVSECSSVRVDGGIMYLESVANVEELEKNLATREEKAAATIQATIRMRICRTKYLASRERRRSLADDLLDFYGADQQVKVQKILLKYRGREEELEERLRAKRVSKAQNERVVADMVKDLHWLCLAAGGLNSAVISELLNDESLRAYMQQNETIVGALRDVSLNPAVLEAQLADPTLREFYEKLCVFLRNRADRVQHGDEGADFDENDDAVAAHDGQLELSLEERVRTAVVENHPLWVSLAGRSEWKEYQAGLTEIGEDPDMLVFHIEDVSFAQVLANFVDAFEGECGINSGISAFDEASITTSNMTDGSTVLMTSGADAELVELLLTVQFNSALLDAMRRDAYFAQALLDPLLASSLQQV